MEPFAHLGELAGCQVDALLLHFRARLLAVRALLLRIGAFLERFKLGRHLLHGVGEFGQLSGDARYVLRGCDSTGDSTAFDRCPPLDLRPQVVAELNADDEAVPAPRRRRLPLPMRMRSSGGCLANFLPKVLRT